MGGKNVGVEPVKGIEGVFITPEDPWGRDASSGAPVGGQVPGDLTSSPKTSSFVGKVVKAVLVNRLIHAVKLVHPGLGLGLDVANKVVGSVSLAKALAAKLAKAKKDYTKAAASTLGSNLSIDPNSGYGDFAKLSPSTTGGGGEQNLHDHGVW